VTTAGSSARRRWCSSSSISRAIRSAGPACLTPTGMRKPVHRATMPACVLVLAAAAQPVFAQRATRRVFVSASDSAGAAVPGLRAADFTVTERGAPREITRVAIDAPMRLLLLVESTSAVGSSLTEFRNALTAFLDALDPELEVGFITTGGQLKVRSPVSADRQALRS